MYTRILLVLLLYGYIAGDDNNGSETSLKTKTDIEQYTFSNHREGFDVPSQYTRQNIKHENVRRTYNSKVVKLRATIREDNSNKFKAKGDLREDGYTENESQVPLFFSSSNNYTKDKSIALFENHNSSEFIQADGTYHMQHYVRPHMMENQYNMQYSPSYSNWEQMDYRHNSRNNPCLSHSIPYQYIQPNHNSRRPYSDPYQVQGTYNIQYRMRPYQQINKNSVQRHASYNTRRTMDYNNRLFINPCMPNLPPSYSPPPSIVAPPRNIKAFISPPPKTFTSPPHVPSTRRQNEWKNTPPVRVRLTPPTGFLRITPPPNRIKGYTPPAPPYSPSVKQNGRPTPPIWIPGTPGSRAKGYTPPSPRYTPSRKQNGWKPTPPVGPGRTPPTRRTKGY